jgi:hypothetical protein
MRFGVVVIVNIWIMVLWDVTPYSSICTSESTRTAQEVMPIIITIIIIIIYYGHMEDTFSPLLSTNLSSTAVCELF